MSRHLGLRNTFDDARPARTLADVLNPFKFGERLWLANVVDAVSRLFIGRSSGNGRCDILNITACPAPLGSLFLQQNEGTTVIHALQKLEDVMLGIPRPIHLRQA